MNKTINKVIILGFLEENPKTKNPSEGMSRSEFFLITENNLENIPNNLKFTRHPMVAYGKKAEIIAQYATKDSLLYVEGFIRINENDAVEKYQVVVLDFQFIGGNPRNPLSKS